MSPREKKLLIFFSTAAFVMANLVGFSFYSNKKESITAARLAAEKSLGAAEMFRDSRDQALEEMEWLKAHEPGPAVEQDVKSALMMLSDTEAKKAGLEVKSRRELESDKARHFHRAKVELRVTGNEENLYKWFDSINMPTQLRRVTKISLSPNKESDSMVDCFATIEQWFVPAADPSI